MKQVLSEKSEKLSVAWFKLAEGIIRGEKERVLTMHRLLMHSLPRESIKLQLEADILRAFGDVQALECYLKAAQMYQNNDEWVQALFLYKIIVTLAPHVTEYKMTLRSLEERLLCDGISAISANTLCCNQSVRP